MRFQSFLKGAVKGTDKVQEMEAALKKYSDHPDVKCLDIPKVVSDAREVFLGSFAMFALICRSPEVSLPAD